MSEILDDPKKALCFFLSGDRPSPRGWHCRDGDDHDLVIPFRGRVHLVVVAGRGIVGAILDEEEIIYSCTGAWCVQCEKRVSLLPSPVASTATNAGSERPVKAGEGFPISPVEDSPQREGGTARRRQDDTAIP